MANFQTHLNVGIFVSGGTILTLKGFHLVPDGQTLVLFALGVGGSLLPDIDAKLGTPGRSLFGMVGASLAFGWTLPLVGRYPPLELAIIWFGLFLGVRFLLFETFDRFTVHRGIWHSGLAAAFAALATVNLAYWVMSQPPRTAWVSGLMVGVGYLTHLCLDEIYSVDLYNAQMRRSFGTALKLFSWSRPRSSLAMAAAVAGLAWIAPAPEVAGLPGREELLTLTRQGLDHLGVWSAVAVAGVRGWLQ